VVKLVVKLMARLMPALAMMLGPGATGLIAR